MAWNNISDGKTDGFVLMYMKNGLLRAVALTQEQADMLDISVEVPFVDSKVYILNKVNVVDGVIQT